MLNESEYPQALDVFQHDAAMTARREKVSLLHIMSAMLGQKRAAQDHAHVGSEKQTVVRQLIRRNMDKEWIELADTVLLGNLPPEAENYRPVHHLVPVEEHSLLDTTLRSVYRNLESDPATWQAQTDTPDFLNTHTFTFVLLATAPYHGPEAEKYRGVITEYATRKWSAQLNLHQNTTEQLVSTLKQLYPASS
jgi:hypothetical protein